MDPLTPEIWSTAGQAFDAWVERHPRPDAPFLTVSVVDERGEPRSTVFTPRTLSEQVALKNVIGEQQVRGLLLVAESEGTPPSKAFDELRTAPPSADESVHQRLLMEGLREMAAIYGQEISDAHGTQRARRMLQDYEAFLRASARHGRSI